jgi:hypothetical protein
MADKKVISHCKACGADIVWMKTARGNNIPVDAETVEEDLLGIRDIRSGHNDGTFCDMPGCQQIQEEVAMTAQERENTDEIRTKCKALFDRLYLPAEDPNKMTAAQLEVEMKKLMGKYGVKVTKVQTAPKPEPVKTAEDIFKGQAQQTGGRGCPEDPDGPGWNS